MDVKVGLWRKLSAKELMLLNCDVGEDSWESLGLQEDPNSSTLATSCKELTHWKRLWCWRDWSQEEKGTIEDEMPGWHHRLDGREFEWTPGVGDGQGGLACCNSWGYKESDTTEWLNWTELKAKIQHFTRILKCFIIPLVGIQLWGIIWDVQPRFLCKDYQCSFLNKS